MTSLSHAFWYAGAGIGGHWIDGDACLKVEEDAPKAGTIMLMVLYDHICGFIGISRNDGFVRSIQ